MSIRFTADDWGLSKEINRGILELARKQKLATVSVLINGPELDYLLPDLLNTTVDLSLHLNLTEGSSLGFNYSFITDSNNIFKGIHYFYRSRLFFRKLVDEMVVESQLQLAKAKNLFAERMTEIDGHHHIHLYPGLIQKLYPSLIDCRIQKIRIPLDTSHLGSAFLGWMLNQQKSQFPQLEFLPYGYFSPTKKISKKFDNYLCHPAIGESHGDPMKSRRVNEFARLVGL